MAHAHRDVESDVESDVKAGAEVGDAVVDAAIALVNEWLERATQLENRADRASMDQLGALVTDPEGVDFVMQFIDRVARPEHHKVGAQQLKSLLTSGAPPAFLSPIDKLLLWAGARLAPLAPKIVMPLAARRMRSIVGHLVAPADTRALSNHLQAQHAAGYESNVNLLGEAVLGEVEANRRLSRLEEMMGVAEVDYVSVKITAVTSQVNHWAHEESLARLVDRLGHLVDKAEAGATATFINFDMEEFHDLFLTVEAFKHVLGSDERSHIDAGIVVQAYLPESLDVLRDLTQWANERFARGGGITKIRLVKGANLAMERVEAAMHGWDAAPFGSKIEADASYRECLDWALHPERLVGMRIGVASHNLFDVAWARLLAEQRGVSSRVQFEMLQGMAAGQAKAVSENVSSAGLPSPLLYTPAVADNDFDVAIGYLFRRLEENAAPENYLRKLFDLTPGSDAFWEEADFFRQGVALRHNLDRSSRRNQDRNENQVAGLRAEIFANEPDTDPCLPSNRGWIEAVTNGEPVPCRTPVTTDLEVIDQEVRVAVLAQTEWAARPPAERREILHAVADELGLRRSELMTTMMHEANKTLGETDIEISEAIDFARWYSDRALELDDIRGATFEPFGVIGVVPPWNFPVAIPAGGVLASLAAGNAVVLKPAPQTRRCAEIVAEACWAAGVPAEALRFVPTNDDAAGRHLVESVDAVILTGSSITADLFRSWKPDLRLFAETSGKNALIITPSADLDLAVADLVRSAFGHGGQKCSAASLAILVGDIATSARFRRQLVDAVESLKVGSALDPDTDVPPLVDGGNERLDRAVEILDGDESWWVEPRRTGDGTTTPGVRNGVKPGSWFHSNECFGPVLGLMHADSLDEAIEIANSSSFGLTGGIHSLDPAEIQQWAQHIEVGNCYVNRPITGAIVERQPFGGWKGSVVGPGAKAGGPNYLLQLGSWRADDVDDDYEESWAEVFAVTQDAAGLFCEANLLRYRPLDAVGVVYAPNADPVDRARCRRAATVAGVGLREADNADPPTAWFAELAELGIERVRFVGAVPNVEHYRAATSLGIHLITGPVTPAGRIEFMHLVREQSLSVTLHRFGNLIGADRLLSALAS